MRVINWKITLFFALRHQFLGDVMWSVQRKTLFGPAESHLERCDCRAKCRRRSIETVSNASEPIPFLHTRPRCAHKHITLDSVFFFFLFCWAVWRPSNEQRSTEFEIGSDKGDIVAHDDPVQSVQRQIDQSDSWLERIDCTVWPITNRADKENERGEDKGCRNSSSVEGECCCAQGTWRRQKIWTKCRRESGWADDEKHQIEVQLALESGTQGYDTNAKWNKINLNPQQLRKLSDRKVFLENFPENFPIGKFFWKIFRPENFTKTILVGKIVRKIFPKCSELLGVPVESDTFFREMALLTGVSSWPKLFWVVNMSSYEPKNECPQKIQPIANECSRKIHPQEIKSNHFQVIGSTEYDIWTRVLTFLNVEKPKW